MRIKKAVILAAGRGTRMLPLTRAQPKEMLPVVRKPAIQYVVEEVYDAGIRDVLIVIGRNKGSIVDHFDRFNGLSEEDHFKDVLNDINIFFVRQGEPKGLGDAIKYTKSFVNGKPFALLLGDDITRPNFTKQLISSFNKYSAPIVGLEEVPTDKLHQYGVVKGKTVDEKVVKIVDMVEKPKNTPPSNLAILGRYILTSDIFEFLDRIDLGYGGELQLTDALKLMCKEKEVYGVVYNGKRYDIGNILQWLTANVDIALKDKTFGEEFKSILMEIINSKKVK